MNDISPTRCCGAASVGTVVTISIRAAELRCYFDRYDYQAATSPGQRIFHCGKGGTHRSSAALNQVFCLPYICPNGLHVGLLHSSPRCGSFESPAPVTPCSNNIAFTRFKYSLDLPSLQAPLRYARVLRHPTHSVLRRRHITAHPRHITADRAQFFFCIGHWAERKYVVFLLRRSTAEARSG